jgi:hypothetical protein
LTSVVVVVSGASVVGAVVGASVGAGATVVDGVVEVGDDVEVVVAGGLVVVVEKVVVVASVVVTTTGAVISGKVCRGIVPSAA